ncbi:peroxisomal adenine nucleotide transporter 1 [Seiridium cupressi]
MTNSTHTSTDGVLPALHHALSGSAGALISTCATYPLSLVITRLQVQRQLARTGHLAAADEYTGIVDAFSRIWRDGDPNAGGAATPRSIAALYTGLTTESAKSVLDSFLFFLFYEFFRSRSHLRGSSHKRNGALGVLEELAIGIAAGACSRAFTTPIANVVTRKQTGAMLGEGEADVQQLGVREIVNSILREKGIKGLWSGYSATLVLTLNPGITFFLQDFLKRSLLGEDKWDDPGAALTFLLAASSKAIASTITYPFQIAKARLQSGVPVETEHQREEDDKPKVEGGLAHDSHDFDDTASQATERAVDREIDAKLNATRAVHKFARQSVFGTIAQVVRTEGVGSLYDGIHGELLKSFFSHGTTMLAKGVVHKLLFKLYLVVAGVLQELETRRRQNSLGKRQDQSIYEGAEYSVPRSLSFRNLEAHNRATEAQESKPRSSAPSFFSRFTSPANKVVTKATHTTPSIILNFQDRTHRGLDDD